MKIIRLAGKRWSVGLLLLSVLSVVFYFGGRGLFLKTLDSFLTSVGVSLVVPEKSSFNLGEIEIGSKEICVVRLRNRGSIPRCIFAAEVSCYCTEVGPLPLRISANQVGELHLKLIPDMVGPFTRKVSLYVDRLGHGPIELILEGKAVPRRIRPADLSVILHCVLAAS